MVVLFAVALLANLGFGGEGKTRRVLARADAGGKGGQKDLIVVHCLPDAEAEVRGVLAERGLIALRTLSDRSFLVAASDDEVADLVGVFGISQWSAKEGIAEPLKNLSSSAAESFQGGVPVILGLAPGSGLAPVVQGLEERQTEVRWIATGGRMPEVGMLVQADSLAEVLTFLGEQPGLVWADLQPPVRLRNRDSAWRCQSGHDSKTPIFDQGLHGEGQVIGIMDTGLDVDHCFFEDSEVGLPALNDDQGTDVSPLHRKVLAVDFYWDRDWPDPEPSDWDSQGHGTHVAGSAAGDEFADGIHEFYDGMAPAAKLVIQDGGYEGDDCADLPGLGCPVRPLGPVLRQAWDQGARIHSNSWGDEENFRPYNRYTERTADVDRFIWNHKDFLVFFAAGNAGSSGVDTVISPATGKNVVAVGATFHGDAEPPCVVNFSSRGWTHDNRIKPDVVVPGTSVISAATNFEVPSTSCGGSTKSGTSMACPTAAGLAALVREYFENGFYPTGVAEEADGFSPSGALVKATLIASAVDLTTLGCTSVSPIPSRDQGWGMVQLDRALSFPGSAHVLWVEDHREGFSSSDDEVVRLPFGITMRSDLKVNLVWTDPPSNSSAATNLINDLDLMVTGPDGSFMGNVFANGVSAEGGTADGANNVEVVKLAAASPGEWTVEITPRAIREGPQDFAVVVIQRPIRPDPNTRIRRPSGRVMPAGTKENR
jgi:subtilisin family serine protease